MAFIPQISVAVIDSQGYRWPVMTSAIKVRNVTTGAALADITTDANGIITERNLAGTSAGDTIELSHLTLTKTAQFITGLTQADAYGNAKSAITTYIAEDQSVGETAATTVDVYYTDESDPAKGPQFLGEAKVGATTKLPYQTQISKTLTVFGIGKSNSFLKTEDAFAGFNGNTLSIPAPRAAFSSLFDQYANATVTGVGRQNLYSNEVPAATFYSNGDKILFRYAGKYPANANAGKFLFVNVGGTDVAESGDQSSNAGKWEIEGLIIRVDNGTLRYESVFSTSAVTPVVREGEITGKDLSNNIIPFLLESDIAVGTMTATMGTAYFIPAAIITYLTNEAGDFLTNEAGDLLVTR